MKYLSEAASKNLKGTAILRLDFNTEDTWRMAAALPTARFLLKRADKIVILSHKGRPAGVRLTGSEPRGGDAERLSLKNDSASLEDMLRHDVIFVPHFRFADIRKAVAAAPRGSIFLLENTRFLPGEEKNSPTLGKEFASLGNYFVNEAFAVSHRANASVVAITKYLPAYAGLELQKEVKNLGGILKSPSHPFVIILGGGKAADKLEVLAEFKNKADWFLLGGAPANTVLEMRGVEVDGSLRDTDAKDLKTLAPFAKSNKVLAPADWRKNGSKILDIGPKTAREYARIISAAKTILWAGPVGFIEKPAFAKGNLAVAKAVAANRKANSVTGGGETVMFLKKYKLDIKFAFISTGGGAMLEFLAGKKLPGLEALRP